MAKLSALIITHNEEKNIEACLETVKWANEIIVVDAYSTDKTVELAKKYTDKIYLNKFEDFSSQKNFCLSKASSDWVFFIDADERATPALGQKILEIASSKSLLNGYFIKRKNYIYGKELKHGGHNKDFQLRLFERLDTQFLQPVHEIINIKNHSLGYIYEELEHYSTGNIFEHIKKINYYTTLEAKYFSQNKKKFIRLRLILQPPVRFLQRYIIQRGFMDGLEGLIYYFFSAAYDFIKYAKYLEDVKKRKYLTYMARIKILYVDDVFDYGGGEVHLLYLIRGLDKSVYDISVACRNKSLLSQKVKELNCNVEYIKFRNKFDIFGMLSFYFLLRKRKYDIVHLQDNRSHWLGAFACKFATVPIKVATVHMVNISRKTNPSKIAKKIWSLADLFWTSMMNTVIAISYSHKRALVDEGLNEAKIKVIYNGVDLNAAESYGDIEDFKNYKIIVGTIARISYQKGLIYLLLAAEQLINKYPDMLFLIIGDGPEKEMLCKYAATKSLEKNVKFLGFKENPLSYLKTFDMFVLPSLYEGLPIAIIEAMASSKPIITTRVGAAEELVFEGRNGLLVNPGDIEGLKKAIEALTDNHDLRILMGKESRKIAQEKFDVNNIVKETDSFYKELLKNEVRF